MTDQPDGPGLLSEEEAQAILAGSLTAAGSAGQSEDDITRVMQWAAETKVNNFFLREILAGRAGGFIDPEGEIRFKTIDGGANQ